MTVGSHCILIGKLTLHRRFDRDEQPWLIRTICSRNGKNVEGRYDILSKQ